MLPKSPCPQPPPGTGPDPDSQHGLSLACVLQRPAFVLLPTPSFLCNKEEVQLQMSSCKVIKLTAWGPVLLRAGQQGRVRVHNRSARRDLLVLTSFQPLLEVLLPHVAIQVGTWWAQRPWDVSWEVLAWAWSLCFLEALATGRLQAHPHVAVRVLKEDLCSLRTSE